MMELVRDSGLNIYVDPEALRICFVDGEAGKFRRPEYSVRTFEKLAPILEAPECVKGQEQEIVYWMFRNLGLQGDEHLLSQHSLRYDLSLFRQHQFGQELMKTSGHYHPAVWKGGPSYPEIYEVAYGTGIFLMQEVTDIDAGPEEAQVLNCIALICEQGEKAIMPADFGHVTLNPDPDRALITTNWVCSDFSSVYGGCERCQGFAWYNTLDRGWVKNPRYRGAVPKLRIARCADVPELGLVKGEGLYHVGKTPELLALLKRPQDYTELIWKGIVFDDPEDEAWKARHIADFDRKFGRR